MKSPRILKNLQEFSRQIVENGREMAGNLEESPGTPMKLRESPRIPKNPKESPRISRQMAEKWPGILKNPLEPQRNSENRQESQRIPKNPKESPRISRQMAKKWPRNGRSRMSISVQWISASCLPLPCPLPSPSHSGRNSTERCAKEEKTNKKTEKRDKSHQ